MEAIAEKFLGQISRRSREKGIEFSYNRELAGFLGSRCGNKSGARELRRLVQDQVEGPMADRLLACREKPSSVCARVEGESVEFSIA